MRATAAIGRALVYLGEVTKRYQSYGDRPGDPALDEDRHLRRAGTRLVGRRIQNHRRATRRIAERPRYEGLAEPVALPFRQSGRGRR
jgi:hypothetical protein